MKQVKQSICNIYVFLIILIAPLYIDDYFFNIVEAKRNIFWCSFLFCGIIAIIVGIVSIIYSCYKRQFILEKESLIKRLHLLDFAILGYGMVALLSFLFSEWRFDAFTGRNGWYVGAAMILAVVIAYFYVSLNFSYSDNIWFYLCISSYVVFILGLLNRFGIDPLSVYENISFGHYFYFLSTIGNTDYYNGYLSIVMGVFLCMLPSLNTIKERFCVQLLLCLCYFEIFITSASVVFAGAAMTLVYLIYIACYKKEYLLNICKQGMWFTMMGVIADIIYHFKSTAIVNIDNEAICVFLLETHLYLLIGLVSVFLYLTINKNNYDSIFKSIAEVLPGLVLSLSFLLVVFIIKYPNFEVWFTRTPVWRFAFEGFQLGSIKDKLIGYGPCCADNMIFKYDLNSSGRIISEGFLYDTTGLKFRTLHGELIDELCTMGIVGVLFHSIIWYSIIRDFLKNHNLNEKQVWILGGLMAYLGQSISNGSHPMLFPFFFLLLSIYKNIDLNSKECSRM